MTNEPADDRRDPEEDDIFPLEMRLRFVGLRRDIPEGREWRVKSVRSGNSYVVTFYAHEGLRFGYCSCRAASFGQMCRHLTYCAKADAMLFKVPMRDVAELRKAA